MTDTVGPTVSGKEAMILELLADAGDRYGLELVEASEGRLKRGTVYVTLGRMEDKGYVTSVQEERAPGAIGLPRRLYRLTPLGRRARAARAAFTRKLAWEDS
jgi:PadR family transcriptional regulator, regulatory protein PadR